ncbi:T9SS type A sorting domain-containing protein [bacterium]|jgi:hypothetical protein|nr:T9SS type A sorting domain-containing protein [bacterium]
MRSRLTVVFFCLLLSISAFAAEVQQQVLALDNSIADTKPAVTVISETAEGLTLEFTLPEITREDVTIAGESWQHFSIKGGEFRGDNGEPGLPTFSTLVTIPDIAGVSASSSVVSSTVISDVKILPIQNDGESFEVDNVAYSRATQLSAAEVGSPSMMGNLRVVQVTFNPLSWNPETGEATVASRISAEINFSGIDRTNSPARHNTVITESFDNMYRNSVANYDSDSRGVTVDRGTYLIIHPENSTVSNLLKPLVGWREELGYNVIVATTTQTGTSTTSIKNYIQNQYDTLQTPLEFVTLVGDANGSVTIPTFTENLSGYGGEGDHSYTCLEGGDVLSDIHLGRISVSSTTELETVIDKIVTYEMIPPTSADPGWFDRALLVGDPSASGITTIYVNQWVKNELLNFGYTQIDTVWSGNFSTAMMNGVGDGISFFGYRGYWGMSGLNSTNIMYMDNGYELPFAILLTCDTGTFESDGNCNSEAFLRAPNGGAVASIGTATTGTHTRYNNCVYTGIADGVINTGDFRVGPAVTYGKLAMYNNYNLSEPDKVEIWCVWNNLMGDPATEMWTSLPDDFAPENASAIPAGATSYNVVALDSYGAPVPNAMVVLLKDGMGSVHGRTDDNGNVTLPMTGLTEGTMKLTITSHDMVPHRQDITVSANANYAGVSSFSINGDGQANPNESATLSIDMLNYDSTQMGNVSAELFSSNPYINIVSGSVAFGTVASGATFAGDYDIQISADCPGGSDIMLEMVVTSDGGSWTSGVPVEVFGADASLNLVTFYVPGNDLDPGESGAVTASLVNDGNLATGSFTATLLSSSPWVTVSDPTGTYASIAPGGHADNSGDQFAVSVSNDCYPGHMANFTIEITYADGSEDIAEFSANVGTVSSSDPVGPDGYGYYIFDDTDTDYGFAPVYDWHEISITGTSVGLNDNGWEQDDTKTLDMPFDFQYYGEVFNKISVCSNGWVAPGTTSLQNYRNWALPSVGTANGLIAAFWDNLTTDTGGVYYYHDTTNNLFIIEWDNVKNYLNRYETFEIIIYDPAHYPTDTGDCMIDIQYQAVDNYDTQNGYATVGLQNLDRSDGLTYTYWNQYAAGAATLSAGRALRFMPVAPTAQGTIAGHIDIAVPVSRAASGVTVAVLGSGRIFTSDVNGDYMGGVPVGTYDVVAYHASLESDTLFNVEVLEGQTATCDFTMMDIAGPEFINTTVYPGTDNTTGPYVIQTNVTDFSGIGELHFYYMTSGSTQVYELALTDLGNDDYQAEIPGQVLGTRVRYWLTGTDTQGMFSSDPETGPVDSYSFRIDQEMSFYHDMESDSGWTIGAAGDDATTGIWTRVDPNGVVEGATQIAPEDDATPDPGTMCFITGQSPPGSAQGTEDVDGGTTTLLSPVFDLNGYNDVTVSYRRWYTNDTGFGPGEDFWVVEVSDGGSWVELENTTSSDRSWSLQSFALDGLIGMTSTVQFRFIASDYGNGSVVEAGVDEFTVAGYTASYDSENPLVTMTAPNGGESFDAGENISVDFTSSDNNSVAGSLVMFSNDNGSSWSQLLYSGAADSHVDVNLPMLETSSARIKVVVFDAQLNMRDDVSDGTFTIDDGASAVGEELPMTVMLNGNYPNPFNPSTEISFALPAQSRASLQIYDTAGRLVRTLISGELDAGTHFVTWNGKTDNGNITASGVYFYRLDTERKSITRKMLLLK